MHILPLSAAEIEKRLSKLPEHVADQTYIPSSEYAQSGKAVAEALAAFAAELTKWIICDNSLEVVNGSLKVNTADIAEAGNTNPISSAAVATLLGNLKLNGSISSSGPNRVVTLSHDNTD